jgi:uncharacterized membrane protein
MLRSALLTDWWSPLTLLACLGTGLMAGTFFVFSVAIMPALERLPSSQGIAAMQSINATILNPRFLGVFLGAAAAALVLGGRGLVRRGQAGAGWLVLGALLYLVGVLAVTAACNVPRNEALDRVLPDTPEAVTLWGRYLRIWTAWNHVRSLAALGACGAWALALRSEG